VSSSGDSGKAFFDHVKMCICLFLSRRALQAVAYEHQHALFAIVLRQDVGSQAECASYHYDIFFF